MLSVPEMNKSLSRESILTGGAEVQRISIFLHPDGSDQARMMWQLQLDLFFEPERWDYSCHILSHSLRPLMCICTFSSHFSHLADSFVQSVLQ